MSTHPLHEGRARPKAKSPRQPAPRGRLWVVLLAPVTSRGQFSPRLLMAWVTLLYCFRLIDNWQNTQPAVLNGVLVPVKEIVEIVLALIGFVAALLSLGTIQKVKLGDAAPVPGENEQPANGQP